MPALNTPLAPPIPIPPEPQTYRPPPTRTRTQPPPPPPPPRTMPPSSHPFLTDQTPYLDRRFSSASARSTSSAGSYRTHRSSSGSSAGGSGSALAHDPCWPFSRASASGPSSRSGSSSNNPPALQPSAPIYPASSRASQPVSRTQAYSHLSVASTRSAPSASPRSAALHINPSGSSTTSNSPDASPTTPVHATIDRSCLVWMREAEQHEYLFGSVASRDTSPREAHRKLSLLHPDELAESVEELRVDDDGAERACRINLKCRNRFGQRF
ncbi:hypothetical protein Q8F55_005297 [Vanrija albida]|uniref:Uncharacterized protein n=1 Tax=Vanrija albida TaxID=181172 RepID=A0ABR3Q1G0_9TREE